MTFFTRLNFSQMNDEVAEASLSQYGEHFDSFDYDFEKAASYHFEDGKLIETHEGMMTLHKSWGDTQTFDVTRENFYSLDRTRLQRMESAYAVLKEEGLTNTIGQTEELHDPSLNDMKKRFEEELLDLKEKATPEFLFTFSYATFMEMAKYMDEKEGEEKVDVEPRISVHSLER